MTFSIRYRLSHLWSSFFIGHVVMMFFPLSHPLSVQWCFPVMGIIELGHVLEWCALHHMTRFQSLGCFRLWLQIMCCTYQLYCVQVFQTRIGVQYSENNLRQENSLGGDEHR